MSMKFGAWALATVLTFASATALADVAGAPPGGGGAGGTTTTSTGGSGGKSGGGCATVSPDGATTSALMLLAIGAIGVVPALRRSRKAKRKGDQG